MKLQKLQKLQKLERSHLMLAVLGLVGVLYLGDMAYQKLYKEPARANERMMGQLDKRLKSAKDELAKSTKRSLALELLEKRSLPWDPEMARERYQAWLLQIAKDAKLTNTNVDAGDPSSVTRTSKINKRPFELYKRFTFSLHGRGDLSQVTEFLYEFYRGGHLQKVRSLSLNPIAQSQMVDMTVAVEALALPQADREMELTSLKSEQLARSDVDAYQLISRRNLFGRGGTHWGWNQIVLRAVTTNSRGVAEAWLATGSDKKTEFLPAGAHLSLPAAELQVVELEVAGATFDVEGQHYHLTIGQSLADATLVVAPDADETDVH